MSQRVSVSVENGIAQVRLTRPEKLNALDKEMFLALDDASSRVRENKAVRVAVLSGEGRAFSAGLDYMSFFPLDKTSDMLLHKDEGEHLNLAQRVAFAWQQLPCPVIAALQGPVFGGGLQIALGADIRIAAPDIQMSVMEIKWGLIPDMSLTQTLRDLVRLDVAKELTFTGRIVEAEEAVALGLATRVSQDPLAEATQLAGVIASKSPDAIVGGKQLLNATWHASAAEGLDLETRMQRFLIGSPNQIEATRSTIEKRPGEYAEPTVLSSI